MPDARAQTRRLTILPLVAIVYHEVSGGPFGIERCVEAAGPFLTLLGFAVFPVVWSLPEALITAELCTLFPENSGYVAWATAAFGPRVGFVQGFLSWLSGVADNALYPVLLVAYAQNGVPGAFDDRGVVRALLTVFVAVALTAINYRGIECVGWFAVGVVVVVTVPFAALCVIGATSGGMNASNWTLDREGKPFEPGALSNVDWRTYLNILFWNLNYWDSASTLAGEVADPSKTFPRALAGALGLVYATYLVPLLVGTGVAAGSADAIARWKEGFFATVAKDVGGWTLVAALLVSSLASNAAQFTTEMSSDSYQLAGMAERGLLPAVFANKSKYGTPYIGILASASGILLLGFLDFSDVVDILNLLYVGSIVVEFAAWLVLRYRWETGHASYAHATTSGGVFRIGAPTWACALMLVPAWTTLAFIVYYSALSTKVVLILAILGGFVAHELTCRARDGDWCAFVTPVDAPSLEEGNRVADVGGAAPGETSPLIVSV